MKAGKSTLASLMLAAQKGKAEAVKVLIDHGADVRVKIDFLTAMKLAGDNTEIVGILKNAGVTG